jgi:hypothetical protein
LRRYYEPLYRYRIVVIVLRFWLLLIGSLAEIFHSVGEGGRRA